MLRGSFRPSSRPPWPASRMAGKLVRLGRFELPLDAPSTHCLCRWATDARPAAGLSPGVADAKIGEPGRTRTDEGFRQRLKRPLPLPLGALVLRSAAGTAVANGANGERRRLRSACPRLKRPLPLHSGLRLGVHEFGASGWSRTTCHSVIGRGPRRSDSLAKMVRPRTDRTGASAMSRRRSDH